jgi:hypothetical protein
MTLMRPEKTDATAIGKMVQKSFSFATNTLGNDKQFAEHSAIQFAKRGTQSYNLY